MSDASDIDCSANAPAEAGQESLDETDVSLSVPVPTPSPAAPKPKAKAKAKPKPKAETKAESDAEADVVAQVKDKETIETTVDDSSSATKRKVQNLSESVDEEINVLADEDKDQAKQGGVKKRQKVSPVEEAEGIIKTCLKTYDPVNVPSKPPEYDLWSEPKRRAFDTYCTNPNIYYYYHLNEGEKANNGKWSAEEKELFLKCLETYPTNYGWGLFSRLITGRIGSQCKTLYHALCKEGKVPESSQRYHRVKTVTKPEPVKPEAPVIEEEPKQPVTNSFVVPDDVHLKLTLSQIVYDEVPQQLQMPESFTKDRAFAMIVSSTITYAMKKNEVTIGRISGGKSYSDIALPDYHKTISRKHVTIRLDERKGIFEIQCHNDNGIIVAGKKIYPADGLVPLQSRTVFMVGKVMFHFLLPKTRNAPNILRLGYWRELQRAKNQQTRDEISQIRSQIDELTNRYNLNDNSHTTENEYDEEIEIMAHKSAPGFNEQIPENPDHNQTRPPYTFPVLIAHALHMRGNEKSTLAEIADEISGLFPYYSPSNQKWKTSVRHVLNTSPYFEKLHVTSAPGAKPIAKFSLLPEYVDTLIEGGSKFGGSKRSRPKREKERGIQMTAYNASSPSQSHPTSQSFTMEDSLPQEILTNLIGPPIPLPSQLSVGVLPQTVTYDFRSPQQIPQPSNKAQPIASSYSPYFNPHQATTVRSAPTQSTYFMSPPKSAAEVKGQGNTILATPTHDSMAASPPASSLNSAVLKSTQSDSKVDASYPNSQISIASRYLYGQEVIRTDSDSFSDSHPNTHNPQTSPTGNLPQITSSTRPRSPPQLQQNHTNIRPGSVHPLANTSLHHAAHTLAPVAHKHESFRKEPFSHLLDAAASSQMVMGNANENVTAATSAASQEEGSSDEFALNVGDMSGDD